MISLPVVESSQVADARRVASGIARNLAFSSHDIARVALVVTEIATNMVKHAREGEMLFEASRSATGVDILGLDRGPGLNNVAVSLRDGFSTAGSPGTGLGAIVRQSTTFDIYTQPERGTVLFSHIAPAGAEGESHAPARLQVAGVCVPRGGEEVSGDAWSAIGHPDGAAIMVADGLGHGPFAADAALEAVRGFRAAPHLRPAPMLRRLHPLLTKTRGAAVGIAWVDLTTRVLTFAGVGNIACALITGTDVRRAVSMNGTVGHLMADAREFTYDCPRGSVLVLHSDGLVTSWHLDGCPGLVERHPAIVAAVLYRDYCRGRDDVTVVTARERP